MKNKIKFLTIIAACFNFSANALSHLGYDDKEINGVKYIVAKIPASNIHLHWKNDKGKAFGSIYRLNYFLKQKGITPRIIMNAGIYSQDNTPAGLHIEKGQILKKINTNKGGGNFHLEPNGVFLIDKNNNSKILDTKSYQNYSTRNSIKTRLAVQSGPMLIINNKINPKFIQNSKSLYIRNAVCVNSSNSEKSDNAFFIISKEKVNLYNFAKATKSLGCNNSLYLDGSISKIYINGVNSSFHFSNFVGMFAVY